MALHPGRKQLTVLDWAAGTGMLSEAVCIALEAVGLDPVVVGYVERESAAAGNLVARMEAQTLGRAPVWDDARTFYSDRDRRLEPVDVFCAGYPCQPFSQAGKRHGRRDPRHLWPPTRGAIARLKPGIVFLENVSGHLRLGAGKVLCDLSRLGFRATCGLFSSKEVGASQRRERLFILGLADDEDGGRAGLGLPARSRTEGQGACDAFGRVADVACARREPRRSDDDKRSEKMPDQPETGCGELAGQPGGGCGELRESSQGDRQPDGGDKNVAGANRPRREGGLLSGSDDSQGWQEPGQRSPAPSGGELPRYAPARDVDLAAVSKALTKAGSDDQAEALAIAGAATACAVFGDWEITARLDPALMPSVESAVRRVADGLAPWADQLRLAGNGVDTLAAAYAFVTLFACLWE